MGWNERYEDEHKKDSVAKKRRDKLNSDIDNFIKNGGRIDKVEVSRDISSTQKWVKETLDIHDKKHNRQKLIKQKQMKWNEINRS
jgi:hypothetical protein